MSERVRIRAVQITGHPGACPSQWDGQTEDDRVFYVRYRHGELRVGFGATIDEAVDDAMDSDAQVLGGEWDGEMATGAMLTHLADRIEVVP